MQTINLIVGIAFVALAVFLLIKRHNTKLVLMGTGIAMTFFALAPLAGFDAFKHQMVHKGLIWSICSVMGFSLVMRLTECDKHLVNALAKFLVKVRPLLIPGVVVCTFLVNISLTSASGVTAAVGAIFIPLLISMGVHPAVAAGAVIFGNWGSMISPGLSHQPIIAELSGLTVIEVIKTHYLTDIVTMLVAGLVLTIIAVIRKEHKGYVDTTGEFAMDLNFKVNYLFAILPLIPVVMLISFSFPEVRAALPWAKDISIPHAMMMGAIVCVVFTRTNPAKATDKFFDGLGKAYGDILGIIMAAAVFVAGMKSLGLIEAFIEMLKSSGHFAGVAATYGPFLLGLISGTGDAAALAFNQSVTGHAEEFGYGIANMGALAALAGALGRAASPIAGATIIAASIAKVDPIEIAKRTAPGAFAASVVAMIMLLFI